MATKIAACWMWSQRSLRGRRDGTWHIVRWLKDVPGTWVRPRAICGTLKNGNWSRLAPGLAKHRRCKRCHAARRRYKVT